MKKTKFIPAYPKAGKTNLSSFRGKSGVYIIKDGRTNKIVYIGFSGSDLYKTITRHFQSWTDRTQVRVTYPQKPHYLVRVVLATPVKAFNLETALIIKHQPEDNPQKIERALFNKSHEKSINEYNDADYFTPNNDPIPF